MYNHKSYPKHSGRKCPFCDPNFKPRDPWRESQCVLNKPLWMVIPPEGVHLECPVHPEGHHVFGSPATFMHSKPRVREIPDPVDNRPWCEYDLPNICWGGACIGTGSTENDAFKFRM
jgi:hypothetical protein